MCEILLKISFLLCLSLSLAHVIHVDNTSGTNNTLEERQLMGHQFMCCMGDCSYELVGDGNPHTDYLHRQMTSTGDCRDGPGAKGCGVGFTASYTFGYTVSAGANVGWFAPGFSVSESWTVGETKTCSADVNATVCLWYDMAYTAYTVQVVNKHLYSSVCSNQPMGPLVMKAPNVNNAHGGHWYCAYGKDCREQGEEYWCLTEDCPPKGRSKPQD
ncbi:hypothetical protein ANOM_009239 [Aspergillus nomiae NRRL 13137]|uniref:Uncharacterized protein n=1 Tax=Aspergillus nomiae NRRL (strain ATCC 15546 / NRRL 13137 / CBS 260.88 / M93) TaxID=1509407 RepID=A0A0L1IV76_ASPN3|nr:uncharacterized protein ANOM_009239 [Aspergillus nomiae NRRL 13137]KNG83078.1 hypothetical protein ANOM_009239 [Aspergillus nomiae NRRL 13137]